MVFGLSMKKIIVVSLLIFCNLIALSVFLDLQEEGDLEVVFLDVGQGNAALVQTPQRHNILIDGGPEDEIVKSLSEELPFWNREIDLMILSHPHSDHLSGFVEILDRYNVKKVLWNGQKTDSLTYERWKSKLDMPTKLAQRGQRVDLGEGYLDVLHPPKKFDHEKDVNRNSVVNRIHKGDQAVLLTGDIFKQDEKKLLKKEEICQEENYGWCRVMQLPSQVLELSHHGSSTSNSSEFIKRVAPQVGLISAGKDNRYNHPHSKVIEMLKDNQVEIHRTYKDGKLRVQFD